MFDGAVENDFWYKELLCKHVWKWVKIVFIVMNSLGITKSNTWKCEGLEHIYTKIFSMKTYIFKIETARLFKHL